MSQKLNRKSTL